ncbi:hypothetical protein ACHAXA_007134 [Cyclostephanos tholiformis]|uniref:Uncharacterized protein n=1 Tax=Cyclostephanos tholiformis TaxID=382380 RepID=A0ABD3RTD3_9STRA
MEKMGDPSMTKVANGKVRGILLLLLTYAVIAAPRSSSSGGGGAPPPTSGSSSNAPLRFVSPLQSYTIFDKSALSSYDLASPRRKFLPRFRAGLIAEKAAREALLEEQRRGIVPHADDVDEVGGGGGGGWAEASAAADERRRRASEARIEAAYDAAVASYDRRVAAAVGSGSTSTTPDDRGGRLQFVGVVNDGRAAPRGKDLGGGAVTWYARRRPRGSKWNVRLVHVNRDAVLRDLFVGGKVDVFGKYVNEGPMTTTTTSGHGVEAAAFAVADASASSTEDAARPRVKAHYAIRERSWRTMWNFSPRRMLTTPSGSFWRERRVTPGLYTDGSTVYESVYRFRDGKNGMKPVAKLGSFLSSPAIGQEEKMRILERLKGRDEPDLVVEK